MSSRAAKRMLGVGRLFRIQREHYWIHAHDCDLNHRIAVTAAQLYASQGCELTERWQFWTHNEIIECPWGNFMLPEPALPCSLLCVDIVRFRCGKEHGVCFGVSGRTVYYENNFKHLQQLKLLK